MGGSSAHRRVGFIVPGPTRSEWWRPRDCLMVGVFGPSHGFVEFSSDRRPSRAQQSGCQPRKTLCTEICAHAICRKFGGRTFLRQFFSMADVKKCRVNTGEKDGGPGRDRTDDLFHAMEARSQLRHRPTVLGTLRTVRCGRPQVFSLTGRR